jgi:hypothetical protein
MPVDPVIVSIRKINRIARARRAVMHLEIGCCRGAHVDHADREIPVEAGILDLDPITADDRNRRIGAGRRVAIIAQAVDHHAVCRGRGDEEIGTLPGHIAIFAIEQLEVGCGDRDRRHDGIDAAREQQVAHRAARRRNREGRTDCGEVDRRARGARTEADDLDASHIERHTGGAGNGLDMQRHHIDAVALVRRAEPDGIVDRATAHRGSGRSRRHRCRSRN